MKGWAWVECSNCGHTWVAKSGSASLVLCANCFVEDTARLLSFYNSEDGYVYTADTKRSPFEYAAIESAMRRIDKGAEASDAQAGSDTMQEEEV